nr:FRIGIDA-like protein 4A [Ipomoea batatas]
MGSIADPGEVTQASAPPPPTSFDEFQRQTSLMTSCTLLWKELSDHFTSLEQDLLRKSEALKAKLQTLDTQTKQSLEVLEKRETSIAASISIALKKVDESLVEFGNAAKEEGSEEAEVDNSAGLLLKLRSFCVQMDSRSFWSFVNVRKKELECLRSEIPKALGDCVDPPKFVMEAISEVFPVDKRELKSERSNDLGWACVLLLESLIPVMMDPVLGSERMLVTPAVRERANEIAETWKKSLDERGGIENVKTPDVHTFLQHLLALSLGLGDKMPGLLGRVFGFWNSSELKLGFLLDNGGPEKCDKIQVFSLKFSEFFKLVKFGFEGTFWVVVSVSFCGTYTSEPAGFVYLISRGFLKKCDAEGSRFGLSLVFDSFFIWGPQKTDCFRRPVVFVFAEEVLPAEVYWGLWRTSATARLDWKELIKQRTTRYDCVYISLNAGSASINKFSSQFLFLKAFLEGCEEGCWSLAILEDPNNSGRAAEYKAIEAEFPPEHLKKRLEQLEKTKTEKKKPAAASSRGCQAYTCQQTVVPCLPPRAGRSNQRLRLFLSRSSPDIRSRSCLGTTQSADRSSSLPCIAN